jgi:hypothetical protein
MSASPNAYPLVSVSSSKDYWKFGIDKTGASLIFFFKSSNSLCFVLPQLNLFPWEVMECNDVITLEKFTMNLLKY